MIWTSHLSKGGLFRIIYIVYRFNLKKQENCGWNPVKWKSTAILRIKNVNTYNRFQPFYDTVLTAYRSKDEMIIEKVKSDQNTLNDIRRDRQIDKQQEQHIGYEHDLQNSINPKIRFFWLLRPISRIALSFRKPMAKRQNRRHTIPIVPGFGSDAEIVFFIGKILSICA